MVSRRTTVFVFAVLTAINVMIGLDCCVDAGDVPAMPMRIDYTRTATHRWLHKPVLRSRLLDDMESLSTWTLVNSGEGKGELTLSDERSVDGKHAIRLRSATKGSKPGGANGRPWGATGARRSFQQEDWSSYNRISLRIYPDLPGFRAISVAVHLHNRGPRRGREWTYVLLRNDQWNHVVWEIPDLNRSEVTGLEIRYRLQGNEIDATETVTFDIDRLELQQVEADDYEGWEVVPGKIAFSHTGYPTGAQKIAFASHLQADAFDLISQESDETAYSGPVRTTSTPIGEFQVMDFSEFRRPGTYRLRAGRMETPAFPIGDDIWRRTIWKTINFFYCQRCGDEIPGVHGVCHKDWRVQHEDGRTIFINGGWHDAGDLTQAFSRTAEAAYAMFRLAEALEGCPDDRDLRQRVLEEACWGLDWVMKTTFRDGYRHGGSVMDFWTNGVLDDVDDVTAAARKDPRVSLVAAMVEAAGARVLKGQDPKKAQLALELAEEDWHFAMQQLAEHPQADTSLELASLAIIAALDLWEVTGSDRYRDKALALSPVIPACQERSLLAGLDIPVTGFFYRTTARKRRLQYGHHSHEQDPVVALARLCRAFPEHADCPTWYATVVYNAEYYLKATTDHTGPYQLLGNGIYHLDDHQRFRARDRDAAKEQIQNGVALGGDYYLRIFPVQPSWQFRGTHGTVLSQAKALSTVARLRNDSTLADLALAQLYWVVGRNPFGQSTMYGEGYDYAPQYTAMSGDMVGSLPVGIKTLGNSDVPYWPATNNWNYKEVWVHPPARWLWLMCDLYATPNIGQQTAHHGDGPGDWFNFSVVQQKNTPDCVTIRLTARGTGKRAFVVKTQNLSESHLEETVTLDRAKPARLSWKCTVIDPDKPWLALVFPDGDLSQRQDATGWAKGL